MKALKVMVIILVPAIAQAITKKLFFPELDPFCGSSLYMYFSGMVCYFVMDSLMKYMERD